MKVSIAVSTNNEQDLPSGHKRKKEGDIIAVKPAGWQWGTEEVKRYLILEIDLGDSITTIEDAQKLTVPQFEDGSLWHLSEDLSQPTIIGKRRYKIPFTDLITKAQSLGVSLDLNKVRDEKIAYQPLEKVTIPFTDMIQDKILGKKLDSKQLSIIEKIGK